ncbi:methyltransferase domain-containing protein [Christiangramia portivictoriae]|uniref:methyltransferase domain-containing protein n=1 Tax=Christiangramia portivictoriae TaxID=326069 RepID=UPI00041A35F3|nr:methyltransferase domain-containing protein [Christiangramia portivictoriae]
MYKIDTTKRSLEPEIMDDFDFRGEELRVTLDDLERVNSLLGGNQISIDGLKKLDLDPTREISIVDVGCGNGAMLRKIAEWGRRENLKLKLTGVDANAHAIKIACNLSQDYPELEFLTQNIFSAEFRNSQFDVLMCTLTLHHFKDSQIPEILHQFYDQSNIAVIINDLQRSALAYRLFKLFCAVFVQNEIARKDGLISILRGFKRHDIHKYMNTINVDTYSIQWKWAFRYLWIIKK